MSETLNYDKKCWEQLCPKGNCKKKSCGCCGLRYVEIPASLAEEMAPKNGAYSNAIVKYNDTGEIWIYDVDGVPVKIKEANG